MVAVKQMMRVNCEMFCIRLSFRLRLHFFGLHQQTPNCLWQKQSAWRRLHCCWASSLPPRCMPQCGARNACVCAFVSFAWRLRILIMEDSPINANMIALRLLNLLLCLVWVLWSVSVLSVPLLFCRAIAHTRVHNSKQFHTLYANMIHAGHVVGAWAMWRSANKRPNELRHQSYLNPKQQPYEQQISNQNFTLLS